jgi:crossover junction endonuclease MUS81
MLIIDTRESKLIELIKSLPIFSIPYSIESLPIGDIIIRTNNTIPTNTGIYEIILERKCIADMIASIKDGRYKEQKTRLLAEQCSSNSNTTIQRKVRIAYLLEGSATELRLPQDKTLLAGSIVSSTFRDNIPILRTYTLQESWELIIRLHERLAKDVLDFFPSISNQPIAINQEGGASGEISYLASVKKNKKDNITPQIWNQLSLCAIPSVSNAIATKITEKYPTIKSLLQAYETCSTLNEKEALLADILLTETDKTKRRIGNVVSKRIFEYLAS